MENANSTKTHKGKGKMIEESDSKMEFQFAFSHIATNDSEVYISDPMTKLETSSEKRDPNMEIFFQIINNVPPEAQHRIIEKLASSFVFGK